MQAGLIPRILEGDWSGARVALSEGADPNETDAWGLSALHLALLLGAGDELWRALLGAGANPKAKTTKMASGLRQSQYLRPGGGA